VHRTNASRKESRNRLIYYHLAIRNFVKDIFA